MLSKFLDAAIPEPVACCLLRLRPFSLGHYMLLKKFCPVYLENKNRDLADLLLSCLICSQKYQESVDMFSGGWQEVDSFLKKWGKKVAKSKGFEFTRSSALFDRYISRGFILPDVKSEARGADNNETDPSLWPLITLSVCMGKLHQSKDEVLNQPLSLSRWLVAGYATTQGNVSIINGDELAAQIADADKFDAEFKAKGGK